MTPISAHNWKNYNLPTYHVSEWYNIPFDNLNKVIIDSGDLGIEYFRNHYVVGNQGNIFASFMTWPNTKIYCQNLQVYKEKCQALPWGCGFNLENFTPSDNYFQTKQIFLYKNYTKWCGRERFDYFLNQPYILSRHNLPIEEYIADLKDSLFVLCPPANGFDTYRCWETLYCGSIPIVLKNEFYNYFNELPIIQIDSYEQISIEFLDFKFRELMVKNINLEKLTLEYYEKLFDEQ